MAKRSNSPCFAKADLKPKDIARLEALADKYNSTNPNADYAAAAQDMIEEAKQLRDAIYTAMVEKAKAAAAPTAFDPAKGAQSVTGADGVVRQFNAEGFESGGAGKSWLAYASKEQKKAAAGATIGTFYETQNDAASVSRKLGTAGTGNIAGEYSGPVTIIDDLAAFAKAFPGFTVAANRLDAMGLGHLLAGVDSVMIAEDSQQFDAAGALYWNPENEKLELYLDRSILTNEGRLAFTVQHEIGHMSDGAFGPPGGGKYSKTIPPYVLKAAQVASEEDSALGDVLYYPMSQSSGVAVREELIGQLFALAANPVNLTKMPPVLANYIKGVIQDAKATSKATVNDARARAKQAAAASRGRKSDAGSASNQGQARPDVRQAGQAQADRQGRRNLSRPISDAARRVGGASAAMLAEDAVHWTKKLANSLMFLHDIVDKYKTTVPAIGKWYAAVQESVAQRNRYEKEADRIGAMADKLPGGTSRVNEFISRSTFEQKWGYTPAFKSDVIVDPAFKGMYDRLSGSEQEVVRAVFAHGEKMRVERERVLKSLGVDKVLAGYSKLDGPYAPLKRFGDYVAVLKSQALRDAEASKDSALVEKLKGDQTHYVVSYFDTKGQARQFAWANDKANGGKFEFTDDFEKSERPNEGRQVPEKVLQDLLAAMKLSPDIRPEAKAAAEKMIRDTMLQYMDEHNARLSGLRRMNRAGYDQDMIRSFMAHSRAEASFLSNMQNGEKISAAYQEMHDQAKDATTGYRDHQDAVNIVAQHYADMLNYKETPWQDRAMALTSAWQLATSVGYHVTNFMQGVMVTLPKLAADFNDYSGAWRHLLDGYRIMGKAGVGTAFDINRVQNGGLREALQLAMDMGVLDVGLNEDLSHFEASRTGINAVDGATRVARSALHKLNQIARGVETMNRVSAATAAYNMAVEKGKSKEDAKQYALRALQSTQGDFSRAGSPLLLKKLPKIMTQYRKYQFMMGALYAKAFSQAFADSDPKERAIGRRMLAFKLAHTGIAAGALGLPLMNVASMVLGALGGGDEPEDLERDLRKWIGDETLANLLLRGPLAAVGLDMSSKLGDDKIFSIIPYGEWDVSSAAGLGKTVMSLAGPSVAQAGKFADGVGLMQQGEYYKSVEKFMPKGVADGMKAFRIANDGFTLKNGDLMFKPEDINGFALALDALGLPSSEMKRMDWLRSQQYEIGQFYQDRTKEVQREYARAFEEKDTEAMAQARQDWMDLQAGKNRLRYLFNDSSDALKVQPLSTLLRYPQTQAKREQRLQNAAGVTG